MKKAISLILSLFLYLEYSFAACDKPVNYLQEGTTTPCSGYLFTPEKELEVRIKIANYDKMELLVKKQDEMINILDSRIKIQIEQNIELSKLNEGNKNEDFYQKVLFFGLGALLTGMIAYGTIQAIK